MRFAVFGTGAVGGYIGARLADAGHEVSFIARGGMLEALQRDGLYIASTEGDLHLQHVNATADPADIGPVDAVIVGTKAWQVEDAARAMGPLMGDDTFVVPVQNGVEAPARLAGVLGAHRVLLGACRIICMVEQPGHLRHLGVKPVLVVGEHPPSSNASPRVRDLIDAFAGVRGVELETPSDMHVATWGKFLFIAPFSGVSAATRSTVGGVRSDPTIRARFEGMVDETWQLGRAMGVALTDDAVARTMAFLDQLPPDGSASMMRDIVDGRPSELEDQTGAIVRLGAEHGVATPLNRAVYAELIEREQLARAATR